MDRQYNPLSVPEQQLLRREMTANAASLAGRPLKELYAFARRTIGRRVGHHYIQKARKAAGIASAPVPRIGVVEKHAALIRAEVKIAALESRLARLESQTEIKARARAKRKPRPSRVESHGHQQAFVALAEEFGRPRSYTDFGKVFCKRKFGLLTVTRDESKLLCERLVGLGYLVTSPGQYGRGTLYSRGPSIELSGVSR